MPPPRITSEEKRLDKLMYDLRNAVDDADLGLQHVFSSHLVLAGAGHVEKSVINILSEYGRTHGNEKMRRFVERTVSRHNSLNCDKIKTVTDQFDPKWWPEIMEASSETERDAVDSLKALRDRIAHGHENGTGFSLVEEYCKKSKSFVRKLSQVILGY
ncbi:MAG: HEPN domain-containing protein [Rhodospirillaceae bacterium]